MKTRYLLTILLASIACLVHADIRITATAPEVVAQGEEFRLEYEVNTQNVKSIQRLNKIPGFTILYGPSPSSYHSIQIINGKQSSVSAITYSYILMAEKTGTFNLPKISVNVDGNTYTSNSPTIKVVAADNSNTSSGHSSQRGQASSPVPVDSRSDAEHISNKDLFITVTANKGEVYEQEPVMLTYRVYTRLNLTQLAGKMPDLKGFMVKEIPLPQQKSFSIDSYNGQNYYTTIWSQYVMFPQQTGKLTVPDIKFEGVVVFSDPSIDLLDEFFNGQSSRIQRKKTVIAPALNINVKPLPDKPQNFSGALGDFSVKAVVKTPHPKEYESLNLQLQISGTGNVDLIKAPEVKFSDDFDLYPPKQNAKTNLTTSGLSGTMTIDYIAVPKRHGKYTIPPIEFVYFDTSTHSYKTLTTDPIDIQIAKGEKNIYADKQREILAKSDIRHIKSGTIHYHQAKDHFWNTLPYWFCYLLMLVLGLIAILVIRHRRNLNNDVVGTRIRGAGRAASARLKKARALLQKDKSDEFYDAVSHAMIGYAGDKLNIPISTLTKDNIQSEFLVRQVPQELVDKFIKLLNDCEFCQFSHSSMESQDKQAVYDQCAQLITKIDSTIKKKRV